VREANRELGEDVTNPKFVLTSAAILPSDKAASAYQIFLREFEPVSVIKSDQWRLFPHLNLGDLEEIDLDIHDLMHIRSFLDHNRPYVGLSNYVSGSRNPSTTGAFAYVGDEIPADELEENLVRHLRRWKPYGRFGLLVLELHTLPPALTANLDRTPAVAYDATHGFSDQYLVELPVFADCAREAGLRAEPRWQTKFPPSELATVSLNYFTAA